MIEKIIEISRIKKQIIILFADLLMVVSVLFLSFSLRLGYWYWPDGSLFWFISLSPLIALPIFGWFGLYHSIVRFSGLQTLWLVFKATSLYALIWGFFTFMLVVDGIPRSVILINWLLIIVSIGGLRMIMKSLFYKLNSTSTKIRVAIFGAGSAGRQLLTALQQSSEYIPIAFVDDNHYLHKKIIGGVTVYSRHEVKKLVKNKHISEILIAIPSASQVRRNEVINFLEPYPVMVRSLPGISELAQGKIQVADLKEVSINDLLGRESILPIPELLMENIKDKVVMVTGAGGSIGSEICRQAVKFGARGLILLEQSELALYSIDKELSAEKNVHPILASVLDQNRLEVVCKKFGVQTIYHAAAYKHVPMVESNNSEGVLNNVFGTLSCAKAAINTKVDAFVLISTDKAVRPTNTMGATKRIAEMVLQALSKTQKDTKFTMVRFGNVLNSSGSVIPLFKNQIKNGGPVTVTHKEIVRYFMTIPEAVELVIQAGSMGKGGEVFVLDMGEPVNIYELAAKMIHLTGLKVKDTDNPLGDIEVKITGLRPGEKLYEELLINNDVLETKHPMIMKAEERMMNWSDLENMLAEIQSTIMNYDMELLRSLLIKIVPEFKPQCGIKDILYK